MPTLTASRPHAAAVSRLGHALADPTRAAVLLALREGPVYSSELAEMVGVTRQAMSNQLTCLRGCGLVAAEPEGRRVRYRLADEHLASALDQLFDLARRIEPDCCTGEGCRCA